MFGRRRKRDGGCVGCGPAGAAGWFVFDSRGRAVQLELETVAAGPGLDPDAKPSSSPERRANYIGATTVLTPDVVKDAPPLTMSPLPHPPAHFYIPAMTDHPYEHAPFFGLLNLQFPQHVAWIDPGLWNVDPQRVDWRRPDAAIPGSIEP